MPLSPNFVSSQVIGLPADIILTDSSTGSDGAITQRRVYFIQSNGDYLTPAGSSTDYVLWDYADASITIDVLEQDMALNILVQWLDVTNVVLYDKELLNLFTLYGEQFLYSLTQQQAGNPLLIEDGNFYPNKSQFRTDLDSAVQAVSLAGDQAAAQNCLDRTTEMRNNAQYLFT